MVEPNIELPAVRACPWCDSALVRNRKMKDKPGQKEWYCYACHKPFTKPIERSLKGGGRRVSPEDVDLLTEEEFRTKLATYNPSKDPNQPYPFLARDRAYVAFLRLAGPRIREALGKEDGEFPIPSLQLRHIEWVGEDQIEVNLGVLKARKRKNRKPPIIKGSTKFDNYFFEYLESFGKPPYHDPILLEKWKNTPLFPFKRTRGYQICIKTLGKPYGPHLLRHHCVSDLVGKYDLSDTQGVKFMGWTNSNQMNRYSHLRSGELADKMRSKIKK